MATVATPGAVWSFFILWSTPVLATIANFCSFPLCLCFTSSASSFLLSPSWSSSFAVSFLLHPFFPLLCLSCFSFLSCFRFIFLGHFFLLPFSRPNVFDFLTLLFLTSLVYFSSSVLDLSPSPFDLFFCDFLFCRSPFLRNHKTFSI